MSKWDVYFSNTEVTVCEILRVKDCKQAKSFFSSFNCIELFKVQSLVVEWLHYQDLYHILECIEEVVRVDFCWLIENCVIRLKG